MDVEGVGLVYGGERGREGGREGGRGYNTCTYRSKMDAGNWIVLEITRLVGRLSYDTTLCVVRG